MAELYSFKDPSLQRKSRLQLIEEGFGMGMQYTNTPLQEGFSKVLANFDLHDEGASIKPRPGLRSTTFIKPEAGLNFTEACDGSEQVLHATEQFVNDKEYNQFMLLKELRATTLGPVRQGSIAMLTDNDTATSAEYIVPTKEYTQKDYAETTFVVPDNAEIHGMALDNSEVLARHVGVQAWNQQYYFFDPVNHKVVHSEYNTTDNAFEFKTDDPKVINTNQAVKWGYNMLLQNPYAFSNEFSAAGGIIDLDGILPYNKDGELRLTPVTNEELVFKAFYKVPQDARYYIKWEWRSIAADTWTLIKEYDTQFTTLSEQSVNFAPPDDGIIMRVTATGYTFNSPDWVRNAAPDTVLAVGFNFDKKAYGSTANLGEKTYTLEQATGMTYWKNRLVVWGVPEDPNILFASELNDPTYFPYPNNVDVFNEPIKYAVPFMDYLLVFTSSKLHLLSLTPDGLGWSTEVIQNNLSITDWDIHLIQTVKNMVFFRSGNYYYMIVPKSGSQTGELTLATIAKPLYYFFDNFEENVKQTLYDVYDYRGSVALEHYYNYLDFEDVHNVYVFRTDDGEYLNFNVLYNTTNRSWRIYCYGSQAIYTPFKADATQRGTLCALGSIDHTGTQVAAPQLLQYNVSNHSDWYVPKNATPATISALFETAHVYSNWQHLDTGYREHTSNFKKRYRELQFVINNISNLALQFYTDFYIDGEHRKDRYDYQTVQELDPASPNYGTITVEKVLSEPVIAPASTSLATPESETSAWQLDVSMFPDVSFWKVRIPVSGKGYTPRFNFTSRNEEAYELLNISYIYRAMSSR